MKRYIVFLLSAALLLSACGTAQIENETAETVNCPAETLEVRPEPTPTPEPKQTPEPTPTPEPEPTPEPTPEPLDESIVRGGFFDSINCAETGDYMEYCLFVPENAVKGMPLIVYLHGDGNVDLPESLPYCGIVDKTYEVYGSDYPFILLMPCTRIRSWWEDKITTTLKTLIDVIVIDYDIDPEHIIITGHSRGAIGVWHMVDIYADFFSAAFPVSLCSDTVIVPESYVNVPLLAYVGGGDDWESYGQYMDIEVRQINEAGGNAQLRTVWWKTHYEMSWEAYSQESFEWMLAQ